MATIKITPETLVVDVRGMDQMLAFRGQLEVPLHHVGSVAFNPDETRRELLTFQGGACDPKAAAHGEMLVGAFTEHGDRIFWDVHQPSRTVIIHLIDDAFTKIMVEVADAEGTARQLQAILDWQRSTAVN